MKKHSKKNDMAALLKNKNVLYIVFFFAIANLFSYLMMKQLDAVAFFIIIGFLTTYFSKNMIIVMLTSMISTFLLVQINLLGKVQEGMKDGKKKDSSGNIIEGNQNMSDSKDEEEEEKEEKKEAMTDNATGVIPKAQREKITATTSNTMKATPESFSQPLNPARFNAADDDDSPRHKPKVDYAGTLESAYDNLDKLLSSDAIKSMTEDTSRLAEKQKQLMGNIEKIKPVMDKAKGILEGFDMNSISQLMKSIGAGTDLFKGKPAGAEKK